LIPKETVLGTCVAKRWQMRLLPSPDPRILFLAVLLGFSVPAFGLNIEQIRKAPDLTPQTFAAFFSDFEFKFRRDVQSPEDFLATRSGDCDDFSTFAASVLRERGFTPRLITVRMPGVTHVVCYIEETRSYLDYNNRSALDRTVSCGPEMESIAESVARSYQLKWSSASEFTYEQGTKRLVQTVLSPKKGDKFLAGLFR
jgi:hypothetical protein